MTTYPVVGWAVLRHLGVVPAPWDDPRARYAVTWYDAATQRAQVLIMGACYLIRLAPAAYAALPRRDFPPPYTDMED